MAQHTVGVEFLLWLRLTCSHSAKLVVVVVLLGPLHWGPHCRQNLRRGDGQMVVWKSSIRSFGFAMMNYEKSPMEHG